LDSVSLFVPETLCFPFVFGGKIIFAYLSDLVPSGLPDIAISSIESPPVSSLIKSLPLLKNKGACGKAAGDRENIC
jgi:hypothetical protein